MRIIVALILCTSLNYSSAASKEEKESAIKETRDRLSLELENRKLRELIAAQEERIKELKATQKELETDLARTEKELASLEAKADKMEEETTRLRQKLSGIAGLLKD